MFTISAKDIFRSKLELSLVKFLALWFITAISSMCWTKNLMSYELVYMLFS